MKIRKIWIGICGLTFIIGCISVFAYISVNRNRPKPVVHVVPEKMSAPDFTIEKAQETIEESNWWNDEDGLPDFKIKLLETGEGFHSDEVEARSGETWFGLFDSDDGTHFLRPTRIKIRRVYDEIIDGKNKKLKTGKTVGVAGKDAPLFLLKNADQLKPGKIKTLFRRYDSDEAIGTGDFIQSFDKNFVQNYELGGKTYQLKVKEGVNKKGEGILALVLESEGVKQTLQSVKSEYTEDLGTLYWVGDLDRDGKPDFYTNLFVHENVTYRNLYLSSEAEKGKLVKEVADFSTMGC